MMYLIWKTDDTTVIASVMAKQLAGLIRLVKGPEGCGDRVISSTPNFGGLTAYYEDRHHVTALIYKEINLERRQTQSFAH